MKKILLLALFVFSTLLSANKVLYLSHEESPNRVIKGEVFSITIKTISTVKNFDNIKYEFSNYSGLKALNTVPYREKKGVAFFEKFNFLVTQSQAKLPDITASLTFDTEFEPTFESSTIAGPKINVITLNPKDNFSNVVANSLELVDYKTTTFDEKHNIIIFNVKAENADLSAMKFKSVLKQGIESMDSTYVSPTVTYFLVVTKDLEQFTFSYFNLTKNNFAKITIPIIVTDDSVTTQSDLKPKDQSKEKLKMTIAAVVAFIIFLFAIWRKKYIYIILVSIPLVYIASIALPSKEVCIKQDSHIYLLPVKNGTIFETTETQHSLPKEGSVSDFTKVKLKNEKIGWVKNEDICSN